MTTTDTLTELDVLREAVEALQEHERLRQALRASETHLRALCRSYDRAGHVWGTAPEHLRRADGRTYAETQPRYQPKVREQ